MPDRGQNLETAGALVAEAVDGGAELVVLPEYFSVAGDPDFLRGHAETLDRPHGDLGLPPGRADGDPPAGRQLPRTARRWRRHGDPRLSNTSCLIGPSGAMEAVYRKIHLFDVTVSGAGFRESATMAPGHELAVAPLSPPDGAGHGGGPPSVFRSATTSASPRCTGSWRCAGPR